MIHTPIPLKLFKIEGWAKNLPVHLYSCRYVVAYSHDDAVKTVHEFMIVEDVSVLMDDQIDTIYVSVDACLNIHKYVQAASAYREKIDDFDEPETIN